VYREDAQRRGDVSRFFDRPLWRARVLVVMVFVGLAAACLSVLELGRAGTVRIAAAPSPPPAPAQVTFTWLLGGRREAVARIDVEERALGLRTYRADRDLRAWYTQVRPSSLGLVFGAARDGSDDTVMYDAAGRYDDDTARALESWLQGDHAAPAEIPFGDPTAGYALAAIVLALLGASLALVRRVTVDVTLDGANRCVVVRRGLFRPETSTVQYAEVRGVIVDDRPRLSVARIALLLTGGRKLPLLGARVMRTPRAIELREALVGALAEAKE
jgi:hypothetical protein